MKISQMRISLLNSGLCALFFILLLNSCASHQRLEKSELPKPYISLAQNGLLYDAAITYKDFHASGILVLKQIKAAEYHVVLLSKFGPAIMEFKMEGRDFTWIKTFDKLENKVIQNFIERDFKMILLSALENPEKVSRKASTSDYHKYNLKGEIKAQIAIDPKSNNVLYAENKVFFNFYKTKVNFSYEDSKIPQAISIRHNNLKLNIELNLLREI